MFNENTLKDMEAIDILVSQRTKDLFKKDTKLFLVWTFPTNHLHQHQVISSNYFAVWVGETGKSLLKSVCFGSIVMLPKLLSEVSDEDLKRILENKFV